MLNSDKPGSCGAINVTLLPSTAVSVIEGLPVTYQKPIVCDYISYNNFNSADRHMGLYMCFIFSHSHSVLDWQA